MKLMFLHRNSEFVPAAGNALVSVKMVHYTYFVPKAFATLMLER